VGDVIGVKRPDLAGSNLVQVISINREHAS